MNRDTISIECQFCGFSLELPTGNSGDVTCPGCGRTGFVDADFPSISTLEHRVNSHIKSRNNLFALRIDVQHADMLSLIQRKYGVTSKQFREEVEICARKTYLEAISHVRHNLIRQMFNVFLSHFSFSYLVISVVSYGAPLLWVAKASAISAIMTTAIRQLHRYSECKKRYNVKNIGRVSWIPGTSLHHLAIEKLYVRHCGFPEQYDPLDLITSMEAGGRGKVIDYWVHDGGASFS